MPFAVRLGRAGQQQAVAREGGTLSMLQHDAQGDGAEEDDVLEVGGEHDVGLVISNSSKYLARASKTIINNYLSRATGSIVVSHA